jgi:hypothetical protein
MLVSLAFLKMRNACLDPHFINGLTKVEIFVRKMTTANYIMLGLSDFFFDCMLYFICSFQ